MQHKLNFRPSPPDSRDFTLELKAATTAPNVDLSNQCTSVKDQGSVGSCTAHAAVAMYEHIYRNGTTDKTQDVFSEKFTYYVTRVDVAKWPADDDSGAYVRDALKSLTKFGTCKESSFPYVKTGQTSSSYAEKPPAAAYTEALKFQGLTYVNIALGSTLTSRQTALDTLKNILSGGNTFIGGFTCYDNLYDGTGGNVLNPTDRSRIIGGHAVCFVGYDDVKQVFKFKNSWGARWGDAGYGYLPYQYLLKGDLTDLWSLITVENNNVSVGVIKPTVSRKQLLTDTINQGLIDLGNGRTPTIPGSLNVKDKQLVTSFFNRVTTLKTQTIPAQ